jgi:hypothetical protein
MKMEPPRSGRLLELEDYLLLAAVLLLPWAFGGVGIWAYRSAALLLVGAACTSLWKQGWAGWGLRRGSGWLLPAFLLAAWAALQLVPLPPAVVRLLSPEAHRLYAKAFPVYGGASVAAPVMALEEEALERVNEARPVCGPLTRVSGATGACEEPRAFPSVSLGVVRPFWRARCVLARTAPAVERKDLLVLAGARA